MIYELVKMCGWEGKGFLAHKSSWCYDYDIYISLDDNLMKKYFSDVKDFKIEFDHKELYNNEGHIFLLHLNDKYVSAVLNISIQGDGNTCYSFSESNL